MGFEAASLQRWTLSRRKWRQLDIVVADDEESAERRFFDRWTARQRGLANDQWAVDRGGAAADPPCSGPAVLEAAATAAAGRHHRSVSRAGRIAMSVAIIDYGSGNLHSAAKAFERAARSMRDPQKIMVTRDPGSRCFAPIASCCPASAPSPIAAAASMRSTACWRR